VDNAGSDWLLRHLSSLAVDQEEHKSNTQPTRCNQPEFYWIFKNMDFERWQSTKGTQVLWLSGPAECRISDASSRIVDLAKGKTSEAQHLALYFFCPTAPTEASITITFASTILHQLVCCLPRLQWKVTNLFLRTLLDTIFRGGQPSNRNMSQFKMGESTDATVKKILLQASSNGYWRALRVAIDIVHEQGLTLMIDGLDKIEHQKHEFIREVCVFIEHLRKRSSTSTTRVLLTSRPQAEIKEILSGLPCIEYDKERKGSIISYSDDIQLAKNCRVSE
jgi:hypothetical protein